MVCWNVICFGSTSFTLNEEQRFKVYYFLFVRHIQHLAYSSMNTFVINAVWFTIQGVFILKFKNIHIGQIFPYCTTYGQCTDQRQLTCAKKKKWEGFSPYQMHNNYVGACEKCCRFFFNPEVKYLTRLFNRYFGAFSSNSYAQLEERKDVDTKIACSIPMCVTIFRQTVLACVHTLVHVETP